MMVKKQVFLRDICGALISPSFSRCLCSSTFALKNVTKSNFESTLNDLRGHVRAADFVAIDLEMTGVTSAPWRESLEFDRFDVRYLKVKDSAEKFAVLQFGVCPFRWDTQKESFIAHPHNFYIFPRQEITGDIAPYEFLCQTASLDFLAKHQFDFNLCIREGISYLSRSQEEEALQRLKMRCENGLLTSPAVQGQVADLPLTRVADILFSERLKSRINEWRDGLLLGRKGESDRDMNSYDTNQKFQTIFFNMRPALSLMGFTSYQLRLIQLVVKKNFKDLEYVCASGETSSPQQLIVYTHSPDDRELLVRKVSDGLRKEEELNIKAGVGFRHVIDLLASEQKLIVGHNCFLDFAHIYRKFIGPLPSNAEEFASSLQQHFPYIIDSKVVLNRNTLLQHLMKKSSSTSLSKAFLFLCSHLTSCDKASSMAKEYQVNVEVQVDDKRSLNLNSGTKHEAGYDAFMTGCVFAQACSHLGMDFRNPPVADLAHHDKLKKYINFLYISWIFGDIIDLRSGTCTASEHINPSSVISKQPKILFSNILLVWGFPAKLKANEVRECFTRTFGSNSVTSIYHLDETAVFIQFDKPKLVSDFLELKESLERNNDPISVLHPLWKILDGGRTGAASYEVYKEICRSPISRVLFSDQVEEVGIKGEKQVSVSSFKGESEQADNTIDRSRA